MVILSCLNHSEFNFQGGVKCIHFRYTISRIPNHTYWLNTNEKEMAAGRHPCYVCFIAYCVFYASTLRLPPSTSHLPLTDTSGSMLWSCNRLRLSHSEDAAPDEHWAALLFIVLAPFKTMARRHRSGTSSERELVASLTTSAHQGDFLFLFLFLLASTVTPRSPLWRCVLHAQRLHLNSQLCCSK